MVLWIAPVMALRWSCFRPVGCKLSLPKLLSTRFIFGLYLAAFDITAATECDGIKQYSVVLTNVELSLFPQLSPGLVNCR